jgi:hypothetical protein
LNFIVGGKKVISVILLERLPIILIPQYIPHKKIVANEKITATIIISAVWYNHVGSDLIKGNIKDSNMIM